MCGVIGYTGSLEAENILLEGLSRLEYRGYDSAGLVVVKPNVLSVLKRQGRVATLKEAALCVDLEGKSGIAHTRWATHGSPSDINSHPHCDSSGKIAVVHNGILENYAELRTLLESRGVVFVSETDTECLAHLIGLSVSEGFSLYEAVKSSMESVVGTVGMAAVSSDQPGEIVAVKMGSPLVIGTSSHGVSLASDVAALVGLADKVVFLQDGEIASIKPDGYTVFSTLSNKTRYCKEENIDVESKDLSLGAYEHYMLKEIHEQPESLKRAIAGRAVSGLDDVRLGGFNMTDREVRGLTNIHIIGCGSAFYASLYGAMITERLSGIKSNAETAGEFIARKPRIDRKTLYIFLSQSGETADTLSAINLVQNHGGRTLTLVNSVGSSIARSSQGVYLHAGPEISVASTKAFTSMQTCLLLVAVKLGCSTGYISNPGSIISDIETLPDLALETIERLELKSTPELLSNFNSMYYIGYGLSLPTALEGAQKMKEVSYIHAEGYSSAELKHGPLALVSANFPSLVLVSPHDPGNRSLIAAQQIKARSGHVIAVCQDITSEVLSVCDDVIKVPKTPELIAPIIANIPLQMLAYRTSIVLGRDIDKPRNLAKSVTVA